MNRILKIVQLPFVQHGMVSRIKHFSIGFRSKQSEEKAIALLAVRNSLRVE